MDPLKYGLLFERFLNPERVSMPDFDIDFCHRRRDEVIAYVTRKYGEDKVGQIITFGTLKARAVIRDVARVLDVPYDEADAIAKLIPEGPKSDLAKALEESPRLEEIAKKSDLHRELIETSLKLEGLHRHASTHAAGIVIGREPLTRYVPLYRDPKTGLVSTQYTMDYLEDCGLVKMDFLGLRTLTVVTDAMDLVRRKGVAIELASIPEDDPATFRMFCEGRSTGAFQFESSGMQSLLKQARPGRIEDLIALNSLYRPGAMDHIDTYVESKLGRRPIQYPLPELEPVLKETYGVPVYQEQVMQMAQVVAGFSLGQADILRRAMGKKKPEEMLKMKEKFLAGALSRGYAKATAEHIFELLFAFSGYGFNKSHAAAYSVLAYHTIYLKANHPAEFLAATCTNDMSDTDRLAALIHEARDMGIEVLPPDVNLSDKEFTVRDGKIVFGLAGIKNVGAGAVEAILAERAAHGPFRSLAGLRRADRHAPREQEGAREPHHHGGLRFAGRDTGHADAQPPPARGARGEAHGRRSASARPPCSSGAADAPAAAVEMERQAEWPAAQLLASEKENLGFFFSGHPLDTYREVIEGRGVLDLSRKEGLVNERPCTLVGILREVREIRTRNGRAMAFAQLEDMRGSIECILFSDIYDARRALIVNDAMVGVVGKIDTTRGDPKVKVEDIMEPAALPQKPAHAGARPPAPRGGQRGEPAPDAGVPPGQQGGLQPVLPPRGRRRRAGDRGGSLDADPGLRRAERARAGEGLAPGGGRMDAVRIALVGLGTVGQELLRAARRERRAARPQDRGADRGGLGGGARSRARARDRRLHAPGRAATGRSSTIPTVQIVVELVGGIDAPLALIREALSRGKHVITANKALLAAARQRSFSTSPRATGSS